VWVLKGHKGAVRHLAYAPDGWTLLSLGGSPDMLLWDLALGEVRPNLMADHIFWAGFTPDGRHFLTHGLKTRISLWDLASGARSATPFKPRDSCTFDTYRFSPDGNLFLAITSRHRYEVSWWAYPSWEPLRSWQIGQEWPGIPRDIAFRPDGRLLALLHDHGVLLFEVPGGALRSQLPFDLTQAMGGLAFSPDGRHLAVHSGPRAVILDVETGEQVAEVRLATKFIMQAAFTPDGRYLATVSNEATVKFWDTSSWKLAREFAWQIGGLRCLAFAPDGMTAAAGGAGRKIVVWDVDL
jgi:WD40 repeat protein